MFQASIDIQQGSGHFLISQNEEVSKIANIIYHKDANDRTDNITVSILVLIVFEIEGLPFFQI